MGRANSSLLSDILKVAFIFLAAVIMISVVSFFLLRIAVRGKEVEVPNVIGKSFVEACEILQKRGLHTPLIEGRKYSVNLPKDHVVEQKPVPKQKVKVGRGMKVFLSLGTEAGTVPRVIGQTVSEARSLFESEGLETGSIVRVHSDNFPQAGIIIAHTPPPNITIQRGSKIDLLVSLGTYSVQLAMPDLGGMKLQNALELLEFSGLRKGRITRKASAVEQPGIVLKQIPQPDDQVERGTIVDIVISSSVSASKNVWRLVKLHYSVPPRPKSSDEDSPQEDSSPRHVKIVVEHEEGILTIFNDIFTPGESLDRPFQIKGSGTAKIYVDDMKWPIETMICGLRSKEFTRR